MTSPLKGLTRDQIRAQAAARRAREAAGKSARAAKAKSGSASAAKPKAQKRQVLTTGIASGKPSFAGGGKNNAFTTTRSIPTPPTAASKKPGTQPKAKVPPVAKPPKVRKTPHQVHELAVKHAAHVNHVNHEKVLARAKKAAAAHKSTGSKSGRVKHATKVHKKSSKPTQTQRQKDIATAVANYDKRLGLPVSTSKRKSSKKK